MNTLSKIQNQSFVVEIENEIGVEESERAAIREYSDGQTRLQSERSAGLALDEDRQASCPLVSGRFEGHALETVLLVEKIEEDIRQTVDGAGFAGWSRERRKDWARSMQGVIKGGGLPVLPVVHAILTDIFQRGV